METLSENKHFKFDSNVNFNKKEIDYLQYVDRYEVLRLQVCSHRETPSPLP